MGDFTLPSLGADMESGTIVEWLVKQGDEVHRGDIVAVVDTDKADIDVEIFESGIVGEILVPTGQRVPVGTPLATIVSSDRRRGPTQPPTKAAQPAAPSVSSKAAGPPPPRPVVSHSPVLRRLAVHLGVDLDAVVGTGPGGSVTRDDVEHAAARVDVPAGVAEVPDRPVHAEAAARPPTTDARDRAAAQRNAIGALMARSKREIPHYYVGTQIDMSSALEWLRELNNERSVSERILPAAMLLRAVALSLREVPQLNGFWTDDQFVPGSGVHLGVAISLRGGGLVAPAIRDVDQLPMSDVMAALRDLVQRARGGHLRSSEMADPTCTVSNLGDQGVEVVYGVIYPPQVALVGFGSVVERAWASNGMIGVREIVTATVSADHRATDGHVGARFLAELNARLQHPEEL